MTDIQHKPGRITQVLETFKSNKGLAAFLEGGTADAADKLQQPDGVAQVLAVLPVANTKVHREQKVFRLPLDIINALKRELSGLV